MFPPWYLLYTNLPHLLYVCSKRLHSVPINRIQIPKDSPTASTPPLLTMKTASVGSGPDAAAPATPNPNPTSGAEVCEEASNSTAREQLTPSTNPPSPSPTPSPAPAPDDHAQVESSSQTDELGPKGQVRVLLAQPRPQNILLRNLVISNNMNVNVGPPRGLLHLDLSQRAPNVTIRAFETGGLTRLHRPMTLTLPSANPEPSSEPPDHHIRVLTPSEIMRTLPSLDHTHMVSTLRCSIESRVSLSHLYSTFLPSFSANHVLLDVGRR